jgi:hypothetical protein
MAKGSAIIVSSHPKGKWIEGYISGTPKPGSCMELVPATGPSSGRYTYRAVTRSTGAKGQVIVLLGDTLQGKLEVGAVIGTNKGSTPGDAYVSGTWGFMYVPEAGDEMNMYVSDVAGTADDVAIGDLFGVETTTGHLKANSAYTSAPFQALETITDPAADYILHTLYLGNNA